MILWRARDLLRRLLDVPRRCRVGALRESIRRSVESHPVLGFGGVLDTEGLVHGGAVKLLSLRAGFPHDEKNFNILYLVSSAQPEFAEDLVRQCRALGIKFVWNQNGVGYPAWAGGDAERHNAPMRRLRAMADFVVYQSGFCRESASEFLGPCELASEILFNPVDLKKFCPRNGALPRKPLRLLAMGTQNYRERVTSVLECVRTLHDKGIDCRLTVAGPLAWKNASDEVSRSIAALNLSGHVDVIPSFRQDEAPAIYQEHHLLVHPKYMDPCPTVVAEALACGLPVVASRSGGVPEMVDDHCAKLADVPLGWDRLHTPSGDQLADAVLSIQPEIDSFSRAARRRAELVFDGRAWLENHDRIFRRVLGAP